MRLIPENDHPPVMRSSAALPIRAAGRCRRFVLGEVADRAVVLLQGVVDGEEVR
jgi:hypothetical protein